MAEWQNGGMAKWQKGGMAEWYFTTYLIHPAIFMVHADDEDDDNDDTNTFKSFIVLKYEQSTPTTAAFVALPRRRQTASPAANSS
jgi:hypothetical protein